MAARREPGIPGAGGSRRLPNLELLVETRASSRVEGETAISVQRHEPLGPRPDRLALSARGAGFHLFGRCGGPLAVTEIENLRRSVEYSDGLPEKAGGYCSDALRLRATSSSASGSSTEAVDEVLSLVAGDACSHRQRFRCLNIRRDCARHARDRRDCRTRRFGCRCASA